jgi:hypothetical protein
MEQDFTFTGRMKRFISKKARTPEETTLLFEFANYLLDDIAQELLLQVRGIEADQRQKGESNGNNSRLGNAKKKI